MGEQSGFMKFLGGGGGSLIGAGISLIGGLIGAGKARRAARAQARQAAALNRRIESLEANRQAVINPYANVRDLSSMVSNPFENLQVATAAAEMRAQEQDISLATTLDTLRATGAGAGGATALAQAASRSKANIAADIQKQEAQNARLRAQGEQQMQQLQMREAARVQQAEAQGKAFVFGAQERREMSQLNRLAAQQQNAAAQAMQLRGQASAMSGQALGSVGNILGAMGGIAKYNQYLGNNANTGGTNIIANNTPNSSPVYSPQNDTSVYNAVNNAFAQYNNRGNAVYNPVPVQGLYSSPGAFGQKYSGPFKI